ncbi:MAG: hypothetical protein AAGH71_01035 [Planctomycetota bacterium]
MGFTRRTIHAGTGLWALTALSFAWLLMLPISVVIAGISEPYRDLVDYLRAILQTFVVLGSVAGVVMLMLVLVLAGAFASDRLDDRLRIALFGTVSSIFAMWCAAPLLWLGGTFAGLMMITQWQRPEMNWIASKPTHADMFATFACASLLSLFLGIGLWLLGRRHLRAVRSRLAASAACLSCGYPVLDLPTNRCPECGEPTSDSIRRADSPASTLLHD